MRPMLPYVKCQQGKIGEIPASIIKIIITKQTRETYNHLLVFICSYYTYVVLLILSIQPTHK